jgi:hypothetical protein
MTSKLITAKDVVAPAGFKTQRDWIAFLSQQQRHQLDTPFTGKVQGDPVRARIDFGRWIADCECGGAEYVDPEELIFYCFSCGNRRNGGHARPVSFPPNRDEIETIVLERPVDDARGRNKVERALLAKPLAPGLSRSWNPGETLGELRAQNKAGEKWLIAQSQR